MQYTIKEKLDLKDDDYFLVTNEMFNKYLENIKHNDMRRRETHKRYRKNLNFFFISNDDSHSSKGKIPNKAKKRFQ